MNEAVLIVFVVGLIVAGVISIAYLQYRSIVREAKNYERGLKMVPLLINLPPPSTDIVSEGRDERDVIDETLSQAQAMYNIISSTATKGFKSRIYGQRHITFEIIATKGLINFYVVVPFALVEVIRQAVVSAYPMARLEETEEHNLFNKAGKVSGTIGGELVLKKHFGYPIATYKETQRDAMRAILNSLAVAGREDGIGIQILLRPASFDWSKQVLSTAESIRNKKGGKSGGGISGLIQPRDVLEALWKAPETGEPKPEETRLSGLEQTLVDSIEEKTQHPGYEALIRIICSSNSAARSQLLAKNVVSSFALFDSPNKNGFKFVISRNMEQFVTSFILRFFPQETKKNILNSVELATIFHLPDQRNIPTSQVQRQTAKQVDGPQYLPEEGILLGYNMFRGVKKEIRLSTNDRRRHTYIIGQTGTGKSKLLENLALQDMLDGKGFAFIDPHGDSAEELMGMVPKERVEDVIYFNPGDMDNPVGLNLFEYDTPDQRDFLVQEAIAMLYRLYDPGHTGIIGPRYEHWFRNAALTIMSDPNGSSFIDIPQVFNDNEFAKQKLQFVTDQTVLDFWNKEMAQTSDYHKSEVLGWFVSKFGAFLSNEMMRNIIGQTKSGFNLREIMDNKKILLVNLSKGKTGELNSQLLGMIFVMKFQAAAMGRADVPEDQRTDFSLYVDEFQNFATDSFESILSEARKYRLNLILANQFMTQLTDKIREAIIGNVGTIISGRIGTTDAELMVKRFTPVFDTEDLTRLPNFETIASVMINNVPSEPFSMSLLPPLGKSDPQLAEALKRLSSAKFGRSRAEAEREIFARLRAGDEASEKRRQQLMGETQRQIPGQTSGSSFLDEWLAKRQQVKAQPQPAPAGDNKAQPSDKADQASEDAVKYKPANTEVKDAIADTEVDKQNFKLNKKPASKEASPAQTDQRLQSLQSVGVGQGVEIRTPKNGAQQTGTPTKQDTKELEATISQVKDKAKEHGVAVEGEDALVIDRENGKSKVVEDDDIDEIYIDVRGNIHRADEQPQESAEPASQEPASAVPAQAQAQAPAPTEQSATPPQPNQ